MLTLVFWPNLESQERKKHAKGDQHAAKRGKEEGGVLVALKKKTN